MDLLVWIDDEDVRCTSCGTIYNPTTGEATSTDLLSRAGVRCGWATVFGAACIGIGMAAFAVGMLVGMAWPQ